MTRLEKVMRDYDGTIFELMDNHCPYEFLESVKLEAVQHLSKESELDMEDIAESIEEDPHETYCLYVSPTDSDCEECWKKELE